MSSKTVTRTTRGRGPNGRYISVTVDNTGATATAPRRKAKKAAAAPPPTPKVKLKNHIALVIDKSSSMGGLRPQMVDTINSFIDTIKARARETDQETTVTLCVFDSSVNHLYIAADTSNLQPLRMQDYQPNGMTALFDGVGITIEKLQALRDSDDPNTSFLILPITDGQENQSRKYNSISIVQKLREVEGDGRWTIAFQVPVGAAAGVCRQNHIPPENVREWEQTNRGIQDAATAANAGVGGFFTARQQGKKKVEKFFVDLSKVDPAQVRKSLINLTNQFKVLTVDKESPIKEFVEAKTGKPYVIGSAYYELTKPETVQPQKEVVIIERGKEKQGIYGGPAARTLLGLQGEHAKLTIANLGAWRPCIKSTSPNRKLVRGTLLLVDVTKITPDQSHFDHSVLDPK